ncbi:MAG: hypothetical protein WC759_01865 [Candidatus Micrarchaeia archaeon]
MDCETALRNDGTSHPVYECVYDTPGGVALVGAGKETLEHNELLLNEGEITAVRSTDLVQTGAISYQVQAASLQKDVVVSYFVRNAGKELAENLIVEQDIPSSATYKLRMGSLAAGKNATMSFSFKGTGTELPEPVLHYYLPAAELKASNASLDEMLDLWLLVGKKPLEGEDVEVTSPSGYKFALRTDEYGKASFKPREVGAYLLQVPHREFAKPAYIYAIQEYELPGNRDSGISSATAFLVGGASFLGPVGSAAVIIIVLLAGWVFYKMRRPGEAEAVVAGEVPAELARYAADEGQYTGLPPEARELREPLALTEEEKFKIMESAVELSPREKTGNAVRGSIHTHEARKALRGAPKHAGRKRRAG